ncbi:ATP-binding cassette domain-containing protein [Dactylosporangium cerinum]|uniref:ATP-binding cassette domain-containing protein n=1 Tax=Dactylosporangium cerinum TaxID=1434730 RepID=A0ABV9WHU2_9ACTN
MIEVRDLRKSYDLRFGRQKITVDAVRGISFDVGPGEVLGFLGSNGAGKTTTLRMLTTLIKPDGGGATIAGADLVKEPNEVRRRIGYVSQGGSTWGDATAREELVMHARMYGISKAEAHRRAERALETFGLTEYADRRCKTYSGGQRRRVDIAMGMINDPQVLFLDEPTAGLDPAGRAEIREEVKRLRAEGMTVLITTHYLDEADALCDRIAIIDQGQIVANDSTESLKREIAGDVVTLNLNGSTPAAHKLLDEEPYVAKIEPLEEHGLRLYVESGSASITHILRTLDGAGIVPDSIEVHRPSLDDVFLAKAGRSLNVS